MITYAKKPKTYNEMVIRSFFHYELHIDITKATKCKANSLIQRCARQYINTSIKRIL